MANRLSPVRLDTDFTALSLEDILERVGRISAILLRAERRRAQEEPTT